MFIIAYSAAFEYIYIDICALKVFEIKKKIVAVVELKQTNKNVVVVVVSNFAIELVTGFYTISKSRLACEQQTYFRSSLLSLRKITTLFF